MTSSALIRLSSAIVLTAALLSLAPAVLSQPQNNSPAGVNQGGAPYIHQQAGLNPNPQHGGDSSDAQIDQMRLAERNRRIAADTAKLVQLSNELKAETDAAHNQLSIDALKKATEIEKTAHDLKSWITY